MIVFRSAENIAFDRGDTETICNELLKQKPTHAFLTMVWENWSSSPTLKYADEFFHQNGIPVTWIVNCWSKDDPAWKSYKNKVVFFDYVLWRMYQLIVVHKKSKINPIWNPNAEQFLFLTGKPYKPQRIGLLYKLYQRGLLTKCNYSLFSEHGLKEASRKVIPNITDEEFDEFVQKHSRNPDNIDYFKQPGDMHYGGVPYDSSLYTNSLFRLVSETGMDLPKPYITEKTWLTVLNRSPFILAGDKNSCNYLQSLGFATFDKIFDITTYDDIASADSRLDHVVNHVEQWLTGNFNKTEVADMVEHNHNRFLSLAVQSQQDLETQIGHSALDIDIRDILTKQ